MVIHRSGVLTSRTISWWWTIHCHLNTWQQDRKLITLSEIFFFPKLFAAFHLATPVVINDQNTFGSPKKNELAGILVIFVIFFYPAGTI